jgi:hypothetical protein
MINLKTKHMNKLMILLALIFSACTGTMQKDTEQAKTENEKENVTAVQLNNGAKWKLDDATKKNVAALKQIVNDTTRTAPTKELALALQSGLDTLVNQCTMKGPDHDALHQWIEPFRHAVKELKEDKESERQEAITTIRKELENFDMYFE